MINSLKAASAVATLATVLSCGTGHMVAQNLPGGASALSETHGNWTVACQAVTPASASATSKTARGSDNGTPERRCTLAQRQATEKGERVLVIEWHPSEGGLKGTMILPFGLALTRGVVLRVDDGEPGEAQAFSTCLPAGCIVPLAGDDSLVEALRSGQALHVLVSERTGQALQLTVPLKGFAAAHDRALNLTH
jgi:invasion protein IalB